MGVRDGELARWLTHVGDVVAEGDIIAEVEAAKAVVAIPAPCAGAIVELLVEPGTNVEVRTPIARLKVD
jgi:pyruvate dehydrogenase E2 component (dihydrolipoamide acetyltransferase)